MIIELENYLSTFFKVKFNWGKITGTFIPYSNEQLSNFSVHHKYDDIPSFSSNTDIIIGKKPYILNRTVYLNFSKLSPSIRQSLNQSVLSAKKKYLKNFENDFKNQEIEITKIQLQLVEIDNTGYENIDKRFKGQFDNIKNKIKQYKTKNEVVQFYLLLLDYVNNKINQIYLDDELNNNKNIEYQLILQFYNLFNSQQIPITNFSDIKYIGDIKENKTLIYNKLFDNLIDSDKKLSRKILNLIDLETIKCDFNKIRNNSIIQKMFVLDLDDMNNIELLESIINNLKKLKKYGFKFSDYCNNVINQYFEQNNYKFISIPEIRTNFIVMTR